MFAVIRDGEASVDDDIVIQTQQFNLIGRGSLDLRKEALDLRYIVNQQNDIGENEANSVPKLVKIVGRLNSPKIDIIKNDKFVELAGDISLYRGKNYQISENNKYLCKFPFEKAERSKP